jgi:hypothetical protein
MRYAWFHACLFKFNASYIGFDLFIYQVHCNAVKTKLRRKGGVAKMKLLKYLCE